jgi:hypothetical protein
MAAKPFIPFKNWPTKSYSPYCSTSINVKTGSPDAADFCHDLASNPLAYRTVTAAICQWSHYYCTNCQSCKKETRNFWQFAQKNKMVIVGSSHNGRVTIGISRPSQRNMPMDFARYATVGELKKS